MVSRVLKKLTKEMEGLKVQEVDVLRHPRKALREGITMIPTLQLEEKRISGIFLGEEKIRKFLHKDENQKGG